MAAAIARAEPLLAADGLAVGRSAPLLHGVTFAVRPGEWWFVVGRNGAGKSTLLLTLLGLLPPYRSGGRVVAAPAIADRTGVGYVPQELRFQIELPVTVQEFVTMGLAGLRLSATAAAVRARQALDLVRVGDLAQARVAALSLGQRRRAMVARALARHPVLLVLDEPTASLDAHSARHLAADLARHRAEGLALVQTSHDLDLASAFATHVALVHEGEVRAGPTSEMLRAPVLAEALGTVAR